MGYRTADEVEMQHLNTLGSELGPVYHDLYNQCTWLHVKWQQYVELYGTKPERIDLLNRAARLFFRIVQETLWEDTLLHLTRLTDPPTSGWGKNIKNHLTVRRLPSLISDEAFRAEIQGLVDAAVDATTFARDWRNRRIAHRELELAINKGPKPLPPASRKNVKDALEAVSRIVERLNAFYLKQSDLRLHRITETTTTTDAVSLLYVIRDGIEAEERLQQRVRERKLKPRDLQPPRKI